MLSHARRWATHTQYLSEPPCVPNCSEWVCEPIYLSSPLSPAEEPLSSRLVSSRQPYNFALGFNPKQTTGGKVVLGDCASVCFDSDVAKVGRHQDNDLSNLAADLRFDIGHQTRALLLSPRPSKVFLQKLWSARFVALSSNLFR